MTTDLQQLLDIEAIKQLKARYFRLIDTKQWEAWGEVFATNVLLEIPEADAELNGRAAVVENVREMLGGASTVHHGHMPEIELTGPDTARGTWAMCDYVELTTKGEDGGRLGLQGYGHYQEEYIREDGQWRIAKTRLERLRVDSL